MRPARLAGWEELGGLVVRTVSDAAVSDRWTVAVTRGAWTVDREPRQAVAHAFSARGAAGVATATSLDAARHAATALALLARRDVVLLDDETARLTFLGLPKGSKLHELGTAEAPDLRGPQRLFALTAAGDPPPSCPALDRARTNLPVDGTRFVGRHVELDAIAALLESARLVTLSGLGGTGKSRLARLAAARAMPSYIDGVWWVSLQGVASESDAAAAISAVVNPAGPATETALGERLAETAMLLVVDQADDAEVSGILTRLLAASPRCTWLVTTRRPLGVDGEAVVPIAGLAAAEASELYLARAPRADVALTGLDNLCRRLDGLPLAIELAAARADVAGPAEVLASLAGGSAAASRPGALDDPVAAAVAQAMDNLDEAERDLLLRLASLPGSVNLAAAAAVGGAPPGLTLHHLERLCRWSLAVAVPTDHGMRYEFRDGARTAIVRSLPADSSARARLAHLQWLVSLAAEAYEPLHSDEQPRWLAVLDAEQVAIGGALAWGFEHHPDVATALAVDLWRYWYLRGAIGTGRRWLERAIDAGAPIDPLDRARLLNAAANLAVLQNDVAAARGWLEESVALRRSLDDASLADALNDLAIVRRRAHDLDGAIAAFTESVEVARGSGGFSLANALVNLAGALVAAGDPDAARATAEEGLRHWQEVGLSLGIGAAHSALAFAHQTMGEHRLAEEHLLRTLRHVTDSGSTAHVPTVLEGLAAAANGQGEHAGAARLLGAAEAMRASLDMPVPEDERADVESEFDLARGALGVATFDELRADGAASREEVVRALLGEAATLAQDGDVWLVRFGSRAVRARHSKGMAQLAALLRHAPRPVPAVELAGVPGARGENAERARKAVRKSLRAAMDHLGDLHPELGAHLLAAVRTGAECAYEPDPPLRWDVGTGRAEAASPSGPPG